MDLKVSSLSSERLDLAELKALFQACRWDWLEPDAQMLRAIEASHRLFEARVSGQLAGFARTISDGKIYVFLVDCIVAPAFRRQGVGKALVDSVISYSRADGLKVMQLLASPSGRSVYQSAGLAARPEAFTGMMGFLQI